ncbi:hypothetical protein D7W79_16315 [Corallococcus exercitus]|uniref:Uncharacterized protein n=3 Tax=Corallococcus exercitus TaxID=2316736 RepID=A0A3A8IB20_9BACT|nr:hypothetical protein [Corallococcus exercitus]RKG77044.1 hypothetical protein D7W79_16315 [Corallococcus exercitus]
MSCCIKAHPLSPVDSCGASEAEAVAALTVLKTAYEASRLTEDDFANNAQLPEWQQACIRSYVDCKNQGWKGRCYDCLRYCEGQHEWPFKACAPTRK